MSLNKVCSVSKMSVSEKLEANIISYLDWGFLDKGAYINVDINQTGCYVGNESLLIEVSDPRATGTDSIYWQAPENLVYESGVSSSPAPYFSPLIYVNNILDNSPYINFRDGKIRPSTTVTSGMTLKAKFSYKWINFSSARKSPNTRRVQYRHTRTDIDNGDIDVLRESFVPLPSVIVDVPPISSSKPYGLDRWGIRRYFHTINISVVGESASDVTRICDYICDQKGFTIPSFDPELVVAANDWPLNFDGTINSGKNHIQLANSYPWANIEIKDAEGIWGSYIHEHIYQANVRLKTELVACFGC